MISKRCTWFALALCFGIALLARVEPLAAGERAVLIGLHGELGAPSSQAVRALEVEISEGGGEVRYRYTLIDAVAARLSEEALARLRGSRAVRYVVPDGPVATPEFWAGGALSGSDPSELLSAATPVELYPWGVERIGTPAVHRAARAPASAALILALTLGVIGALGWGRRGGRRWVRAPLGGLMAMGVLLLAGCSWVYVLPHPGILGGGVRVALLDTGVDLDHPDLRDNILGGIDLFNRDEEPQDDNGHGTGVAGILAAVEDGRGLIGVAPRVGLWAIKMLGPDEQGSISDLIAGIEWAVEHGAQVINMSLGTEEDNPALLEAIRAAYRAGVLLVAAAGNQGDRVLYPAAYPEVIAVSATDRTDRRAWFSNTGPEVELAAPGVQLLTTGLDGGYQERSGTSFAVPHVSGVAALLLSAGLGDAREVRRRLAQTAVDLGLALSAQGYGLVSAEQAVLGGR